jgi:hypothetical protein
MTTSFRSERSIADWTDLLTLRVPPQLVGPALPSSSTHRVVVLLLAALAGIATLPSMRAQTAAKAMRVRGAIRSLLVRL